MVDKGRKASHLSVFHLIRASVKRMVHVPLLLIFDLAPPPQTSSFLQHCRHSLPRPLIHLTLTSAYSFLNSLQLPQQPILSNHTPPPQTLVHAQLSQNLIHAQLFQTLVHAHAMSKSTLTMFAVTLVSLLVVVTANLAPYSNASACVTETLISPQVGLGPTRTVFISTETTTSSLECHGCSLIVKTAFPIPDIVSLPTNLILHLVEARLTVCKAAVSNYSHQRMYDDD